MKRCIFPSALLSALFAVSGTSQAALTFFTNNVAGFNAANSGNTLVGTEDWENNNLAPATISTAFSDPLLPGVSKGPFPSGSSTALNMRVQANTGGLSSASLALRGDSTALVAASDGASGFSGNIAPSSQLSINNTGDSLDMIFNTPFSSVSFVPLYFSDAGQSSFGTLTVSVYSTANALLGTTTIEGVQDALENSFIGMVSTGGVTIGRINVSDSSSANNYAGADSISGYAVPEPGATVLLACAIICMSGTRNRKRF